MQASAEELQEAVEQEPVAAQQSSSSITSWAMAAAPVADL